MIVWHLITRDIEMGYYVRTAQCTVVIPAQHLERVYEILCNLNKYNELKRGGSWSGGKQTKWWFSWMDENYPETCNDAMDIFKMLGFDCEYNNQGDLCLLHYDQKTGQEDLFLKVIANYATGMIRWVGEDGEIWDTDFDGDSVIDGECREIFDRMAIEQTKKFLGFVSTGA